MSRAWCLGALMLLGGCAKGTAPAEPGPVEPQAVPYGLFKIMETPEIASYFAANSVALYHGKPQLRQFYIVHNYSNPARVGDDKLLVSSSRALLVINCERDEKAQFGRTYFSEPFAQGVEIVSKPDVPQWEAFERQSMLGQLRNITCALDPARMRSSRQ